MKWHPFTPGMTLPRGRPIVWRYPPVTNAMHPSNNLPVWYNLGTQSGKRVPSHFAILLPPEGERD